MKNKPLSSIVEANQKDWLWVAQRLAESIRYWIADRKYWRNKPYSKKYAERKSLRKAARKGVPQASTSSVPDGTLTGKMLQGIRAKSLANGHGALLQWLGANAQKIQWAEDQGRPITTSRKPLIDPVNKELDKDIDKMYERRVKDTGGTTRIKL